MEKQCYFSEPVHPDPPADRIEALMLNEHAPATETSWHSRRRVDQTRAQTPAMNKGLRMVGLAPTASAVKTLVAGGGDRIVNPAAVPGAQRPYRRMAAHEAGRPQVACSDQ